MTSYWPRIAVFIGICAILSSMVVVSRAQQSPAPRVWSMETESSASGTVTFTVTFSEAVEGVDTHDFRMLESQDASISNVRAGANTSTYLVDVSYGQSISEIVLVLLDDDSIVNEAEIPLGGQGLSNGNAVSQAYTPRHSTSSSRTDTHTIIPMGVSQPQIEFDKRRITNRYCTYFTKYTCYCVYGIYQPGDY